MRVRRGVLSRWAALWLALSVVVPATGSAGSRLSVVASGTRTEFRTGNEFPFRTGGDRGYGAGLLLGIESGRLAGLEIGGVYGRQRFVNDPPGGAEILTDVWNLQVPVLARLWLGEVFSIGAGGYYSFAFTEGARDDYGALASIAAVIPAGSVMGIRLDARYQYGVKVLTQAGGDHAASATLQALVGLDFRF